MQHQFEPDICNMASPLFAGSGKRVATVATHVATQQRPRGTANNTTARAGASVISSNLTAINSAYIRADLYAYNRDCARKLERMAYETFTGTRNAPSKGPWVRVNREGRFSLNKAATALMRDGSVRWICLKSDRTSKKIAFQKLTKPAQGSVEIKYRNEAGTSGFNSKSFAQWSGLDLTKSNTYPVDWNRELNALEFCIENGPRKTSK